MTEFLLWSNVKAEGHEELEFTLASRMLELVLDAGYRIRVRSLNCTVTEGHSKNFVAVWVGTVVFLRTSLYRVIVNHRVDPTYIELYHLYNQVPISRVAVDFADPNSIAALDEAMASMVRKAMGETWSGICSN